MVNQTPSTAENLRHLEMHITDYMHEHVVGTGDILYVVPKGFRFPYRNSFDTLDDNMKYLEMQLEEFLHDHETVVSSATEKLPDPSVDSQQTTIPRFDATLTADDFYAWGSTSSASSFSITASTTNPQASTKHIRISLSANVADTPQIVCVNPSLPGFLAGGLFRVATASPGDEITASLYARKTPLFGGGFDNMDMIIDYFDSGFNYLSSTVESNVGPMTTSYQQFTMSPATAPANTAYIGFRVDVDAFFSGDIVDIDTLSVSVGTDEAVLYTNQVGFRFPHPWEEEWAIKENVKHLEDQLSRWLHAHEVGT